MKQQGGTATPPPPPSSLDIIIALGRSFWLPWIKKTHYQSSASLARERNATSSNSDQRSNPDYLSFNMVVIRTMRKMFFLTYAIFEIFDFFPSLVPLFFEILFKYPSSRQGEWYK